MSTGYGRRRRRRLSEEADFADELERAEVEEETRRSRRPPGRALILLGLLGLAVWFAPAIVARTPLLNVALRSITSDVRGMVTARDASLGWLSPVVLRDLELRDREGQLVGRADRLTGETPLWNLVLNPSRLSRVTLEHPEFHVVVTTEGSNLEEVLANYLDDDDPSGSSPVGFSVSEAKIAVSDKPTGREWRLTGLDANGRWPGDTGDPLELELDAEIAAAATAGGQPGRLELKLRVPATEARGSESAGELALRSSGFPLELVEAALRRTPYASRWGGTATAQVDCTWNHSGQVPSRRIAGQIEATNLVLAGSWLGPDELRLARLAAPGTATWVGDKLEVEQLALNTELGQVAYQGTIDTAQGLAASLASQTYELKGQLDLSKLAAALPHTIRVREGTQVTDGLAKIEITSRPGAEGQAWRGQLVTSNLVAVNQGRQLTWEKPITITFDGRDTRAGIVLDHLLCQSSFLELEAAGTPEYLSVSSSYNLEQLARELARFYDLGDWQLSGDGWSHTTWRQDAQGQFEVDGEVQVRNFQLVRPDAHPWREDNLLVFLEAAGRLAERQLAQLDRGKLTVESGADRLLAQLERPLTRIDRETVWPLALELQGELARWQPRLEPWGADLAGHDLAGQTQLAARARYHDGTLELDNARARIDRLRYLSAGWRIDEPSVELTLDRARWNGAGRQLEIQAAAFRSSAVNVDASDIRGAWPATGPAELAGSLAYVGDLARLSAWRAASEGADDWQLAGQLGGQATVRRSEGVTTARVDGQIDNLVAQGREGQPWRERQVRWNLTSAWDHERERITLDRCEVDSGALRCRATGKLAELSRERQVELEGQLDYDAETLRPLIERFFGRHVALGGRQSERFAVRGPLRRLGQPQPGGNPAGDPWDWTRDLTGEASLGWQWADLYGFRAGPARVRTTLRGGTATIDPVTVALSEGRVNLAGEFRLTPGPAELRVPAGPLADNVRISPEMCERALKFVAPILADVAQAQGTFSVKLDGCRLPLEDPTQGDVAGHLLVHDVEVGAGPLLQELAVLLNRGTSVRLKRESDVQFRMVGGRVYHRDLVLEFPDATIKSYGSVGLDETLAIMLELPVPPKWIGNNRLGETLRNQTIRLPLGGTLSQPRLDKQVLDQTMAQLLQNSAGQLFFNEIGRQLDRILQPPVQR